MSADQELTATTAIRREQLRLPAASLPARIARIPLDTFRYGLPTAGVNFFTAARQPIDAGKVWGYFTQRPPAPVQAFIDGYPFAARRQRIIADIFKKSSAEGIEYHYDLSNDFYELFLDRRFMFYSCADFNLPDDTIEQAQSNKADHILGLLQPRPGEKIVELGCGWGSMMRHVFASTGDRDNLSGMTLSRDQYRYIDEKLGFNVRLVDFISAGFSAETCDKFYSIGAMEHVRPDAILPLYRRLWTALRPGGRLVLHFFCLNGSDRLPTSMIGSQVYFPGSLLALHSDHLAWAGEAGFRLTHDSSHDYRPTLRAWFDRLVENRERAHALVGVQTTNKYLCFFASSWAFFDQRLATLHRLVLMKD